jgi:hypothetical protein
LIGEPILPDTVLKSQALLRVMLDETGLPAKDCVEFSATLAPPPVPETPWTLEEKVLSLAEEVCVLPLLLRELLREFVPPAVEVLFTEPEPPVCEVRPVSDILLPESMRPVAALPLAEDDVPELTPMVGDPTGTSWVMPP